MVDCSHNLRIFCPIRTTDYQHVESEIPDVSQTSKRDPNALKALNCQFFPSIIFLLPVRGK